MTRNPKVQRGPTFCRAPPLDAADPRTPPREPRPSSPLPPLSSRSSSRASSPPRPSPRAPLAQPASLRLEDGGGVDGRHQVRQRRLDLRRRPRLRLERDQRPLQLRRVRPAAAARRPARPLRLRREGGVGAELHGGVRRGEAVDQRRQLDLGRGERRGALQHRSASANEVRDETVHLGGEEGRHARKHKHVPHLQQWPLHRPARLAPRARRRRQIAQPRAGGQQ
mmetsp:Transcript_7322/g.21632  ORF Transcript_7322/g.21632 Transcript_7322/m.21632 type:complete len:224 (+) Transcript_7322:142-813(+)